MPEMKSAPVLISPSRATLAVRFICSEEYAREEGGSCDELSAPLSTASLVPTAPPLRRASASSRRAPSRLQSLAPISPCRAPPRLSVPYIEGKPRQAHRAPSWIEGDRRREGHNRLDLLHFCWTGPIFWGSIILLVDAHRWFFQFQVSCITPILIYPSNPRHVPSSQHHGNMLLWRHLHTWSS